MCVGSMNDMASQANAYKQAGGTSTNLAVVLGGLFPGGPSSTTSTASTAATPTAAPSVKAGAAVSANVAKTGGNSVTGVGSVSSPGAGLLTPAFAPGSVALKSLTGQ